MGPTVVINDIKLRNCEQSVNRTEKTMRTAIHTQNTRGRCAPRSRLTRLRTRRTRLAPQQQLGGRCSLRGGRGSGQSFDCFVNGGSGEIGIPRELLRWMVCEREADGKRRRKGRYFVVGRGGAVEIERRETGNVEVHRFLACV